MIPQQYDLYPSYEGIPWRWRWVIQIEVGVAKMVAPELARHATMRMNHP
jgi:hypothetical protein